MSGSIACPYKILGVSNLAENDEIEQAFEVYKQAYELLIDGEKRRAHDRQAANEEKKLLQLKIEQLEKKLQKKSKNGDEELEKLRKELGKRAGAGHFWGNDNGIKQGGVRDEMGENELKKVLQLLAAGEKKINLKEREKFHICHNWNVAEAGWTIQFQSALKHWDLWLEQKGVNAKFKATAEQIHPWTGEEANRRELQSETDGSREVIKYELVSGAGAVVRFNITLL